MTIDNFNKIKALMSFDNEDEFYFIQIIKRRKDSETLANNHRVIKTYYIDSFDRLNNVEDEIASICESNSARAYIWLTKRSYKKVAFLVLEEAAMYLRSEMYKPFHRIYNSCCKRTESRVKTNLWVVDIDDLDLNVVRDYGKVIEDCEGKIITTIRTVNGYHLITEGFNTKLFNQKCIIAGLSAIDIHKNNPTILYYKDAE